MTVNLTINELSIKEASELLKFAQEFSTSTNPTVPLTLTEAVRNLTAESESQQKEPEKITLQSSKSHITIEEVRAAFVKFAKANGKDAAKEILTRFNSAKVTELKEEDYAAVMAALGEG